MESRVSIITLGVADLEVSSSFYENIFGWQATGASNDNVKFYQLNGMMLSLYPKAKLAEDVGIDHEGSGFKAITLAYCTRSEEELYKMMERFRANGVTIVKDAQKVFWGGHSGYIADPDGHLWELAYNPYVSFDKNGNIA